MPPSPRKRSIKADRSKERQEYESRVQLALHDLQEGRFKHLSHAATAHGVAVSTLWDRQKGMLPKSAAHAGQQTLAPTQEEAIVRYIQHMAAAGFPLTAAELNALATAYHRENTSNPLATISRNWLRGFLYRHSSLTSTYSQCLDHARAKASCPEAVQSFFTRLDSAIREYNIAGHQIFNMDETGFMLGVSAPQRVIVPKANRASRFKTQPGNRENITVIECIGSGGQTLPPMVIFRGQNHLVGWHRDLVNIPPDWTYCVTPSGWTDSATGLKWLQTIFEPRTRPANKQDHRLLLLDGHVSHVSPEFISYCWDHRIVPLCFPPHSMHILQPLDVSIFGPLTDAYRKGVAQLASTHTSINKNNFSSLYLDAWKVINSRSARKAFVDIGIGEPTNPHKVLERLPGYQRPSTPPPTDCNTLIPATPTTRKECIVLVNHLRDSLEETDRTNRAYLLKIFKAFSKTIDERIALKTQLERLEKSLAHRHSRQRGDQATLSQARIITREQAVAAQHAREAKEQEKAMAALRRKEKQEEAKKKAQTRTPAKTAAKGKQKEVLPPLGQPSSSRVMLNEASSSSGVMLNEASSLVFGCGGMLDQEAKSQAREILEMQGWSGEAEGQTCMQIESEDVLEEQE